MAGRSAPRDRDDDGSGNHDWLTGLKPEKPPEIERHESWQPAPPSPPPTRPRATASAGHKTRAQVRAEERAAEKSGQAAGAAKGSRAATTPPAARTAPPPPPPPPPPPSSQSARAEQARRGTADGAPLPPSRRDQGPAAHPGTEPPEHHRRRLSVPLLICGLVLLGWAGLCFIDTSQPTLIAATTLAPVLSVLCLPVLAIAVARRQAIPAVMAFVAAIVPWALVVSSGVAGPGPTSEAGHQLLRVMTVDGGGGTAKAATIVRATRQFDVDVLVVTGMTSRLAHDLTTAGLPSMVTPRWVNIPAGKRLGAGMWSKAEVSGTPTAIAAFSHSGGVMRLNTAGGPVSMVVAQAGGSGIVPDASWNSDLKALGAVDPAGPRILAGDLGGTPWHPAFRSLRSHGWYEAADVLGRGLRPTWPAFGPVPIAPLDQVMVGGGAGVSRADSVRIPGTDHRALLVTVVLPSGSGSAGSTEPGD